MPGRLRTASRPSRTVIELASYAKGDPPAGDVAAQRPREARCAPVTHGRHRGRASVSPWSEPRAPFRAAQHPEPRPFYRLTTTGQSALEGRSCARVAAEWPGATSPYRARGFADLTWRWTAERPRAPNRCSSARPPETRRTRRCRGARRAHSGAAVRVPVRSPDARGHVRHAGRQAPGRRGRTTGRSPSRGCTVPWPSSSFSLRTSVDASRRSWVAQARGVARRR